MLMADVPQTSLASYETFKKVRKKYYSVSAVNLVNSWNNITYLISMSKNQALPDWANVARALHLSKNGSNAKLYKTSLS